MAKLLSLLKVQLNSQLGISLAKYSMKNDKKALLKGIGLGFAILIAVGQFAVFYTFLMIKLHEAGQTIGAPQLILIMGAAGAGLFVLFFGIFYILSALFLAKDTEFLASMPLPQGSVFLTKFFMVLLGEYPFAFFLMLPPVIIYGIGAGKGLLYYLAALAGILLLPLIPLVVSSLLSLILMRIVSRSRRRDLITIIGSVVLLIVVILGQSYFFSRIPENDPDIILKLLQDSDRLIEFAGRVFPPAVWITRSLSLSGADALINLVYLIAFSLAAFGIVYFLASFIYQKGATAQFESVKKTSRTKITYKVSPTVRVMFMTEWKNLLRTPIYALNSLVMIFVGPLLMCMPLLGGNFANDPDIQAIYNLIETSRLSPVLVLILAGILALVSQINPALSSTFSREGKSFWILKSIPVAPFRQVLGKLIAGYSISLMAASATSVIMGFAFRLDIVMILMSLALSLLALIPICVLGILIDLRRPKLNWGNPQEAIKQNANVMLAMLFGFILFAVMGGIGFLLLQVINNTYILFVVFALVLAAISAGSMYVLKKASHNAYQRIDA